VKKKILHYLKEIILFILMMTLFANMISLYKSQELNSSNLPAIDTKLINNDRFTTPIKKPILVHIWATWCPTCKLEAGNIQRVSQSYEVITFAVKSGSDGEIKEFLEKNDLNFKVINDSSAKWASNFNISAYPTTFIYDKNGKLIFSEVGYTSTVGLYLRMWWASFRD